jgi:hypothetical protein
VGTEFRRQCAANDVLSLDNPREMNPNHEAEPRVPAISNLSRLGTMGVPLLACTTAGVRTARWVPLYPALPQDLHAPRSPNPDVYGRRVSSCERNPCWVDCTTNTRFDRRRRSVGTARAA